MITRTWRGPSRRRSGVLTIDGVVNLLLGIVLMTFPRPLVETLGIPQVANGFYPAILGAVLFGIGIALCVEAAAGEREVGGVGLVGALSINLSAAAVLAGWLAVGELGLPPRGYVVLWVVVVLLVGLSMEEWRIHRREVSRTLR